MPELITRLLPCPGGVLDDCRHPLSFFIKVMLYFRDEAKAIFYRNFVQMTTGMGNLTISVLTVRNAAFRPKRQRGFSPTLRFRMSEVDQVTVVRKDVFRLEIILGAVLFKKAYTLFRQWLTYPLAVGS